MRRRFLRFATDEDEVRLHSNDISVLLAKTKIQPLGEKVFHIRGDEVRLPEGLFTGEWGEAFQSGSVQVILQPLEIAPLGRAKNIYVQSDHQLNGHPRKFENWPLNRGWPLKRGTI